MYRNRQMARIEEKLDRILAALEGKASPEQLPPGYPPPLSTLQPSAPEAEPLPGYDALNVAETLDALKEYRENSALLARTLQYEQTHKKRATVIEQLGKWLE